MLKRSESQVGAGLGLATRGMPRVGTPPVWQIFAVVDFGCEFNMRIIVNGLAVSNDGIAVFKICASMDFMHHVRHINGIAGIGIDTLSRVMAKNAKSDFRTGSAMHASGSWQRLQVAVVTYHVEQQYSHRTE